MQIRIRHQECCGNGECVLIAPDVFVMGSKQKVVVVDPDATAEETVFEAAEACPCSAIILLDNDGNEIFP